MTPLASHAAPSDWLDNRSLLAPPRLLAIDEPLPLDCGRELASYQVRFEAYGRLSQARDNAILVCHSLTKGAHAAGKHAPGERACGWWDAAIGPGKMLDTDRYFVICADTLAAGPAPGSGQPGTGPASTDPATGRHYGMDFPVVTVTDMVRAQRRFTQLLGIERLHAVIGGCFGGQQALEWAIRYPDGAGQAIVITTTPATSGHTIAIFSVMRRLIKADPAWNGGDYYDGPFPSAGLGAAVAAGVPLWMSREAVEARFGRHTADGSLSYTMRPEFAVETFIERVADGAGGGIDPNGLMYLMRAVEYFDLEREYGSLQAAMAPVRAPVLFVSYRRDWRYPSAETQRIHEALLAVGGTSEHAVLDSKLGHGGFIYDVPGLRPVVTGFLSRD